MMSWVIFVGNSALLGAGLAMDAFSVSMANGLRDAGMGTGQALRIAGTFAFFQFIMPLAGWPCVHTDVEHFQAVQPWIPWIALLLLLYVGGSMILEGVRGLRRQKRENNRCPATAAQEAEKKAAEEETAEEAGKKAAEQAEEKAAEEETAGSSASYSRKRSFRARVSWPELLLQGIATSIDALSVGFTIASYGAGAAFLCAAIIAAVTLVICLAGVRIGRRFGEYLKERASVFGGVILVAIGLEIFLKAHL